MQYSKQEFADTRDNLNEQRENALKLLERHKRLTTLVNNPDFVEIIEKGFCGSEMLNYITHSVDDTVRPESREESLQNALAGGRLTLWINRQLKLSSNAQSVLDGIDEQLEHLNTQDV